MTRPSFTGRRRSRLARRFAAMEMLESRSLVTESLGIMLAGIAVPTSVEMIGAGATGAAANDAGVVEGELSKRQRSWGDAHASGVDQPMVGHADVEAGSGKAAVPGSLGARSSTARDWLNLADEANVPTAPPILASPSASVRMQEGTADSSAGGSGAVAPGRGAVSPLRIPPPQSVDAPSASAAPMSALADTTPYVMEGSGSNNVGVANFGGGSGASGGLDAIDAGLLSISGEDTSVAQGAFQNFPLYTLDYTKGSVLFPGHIHYATLATPVDLRAQVRDTTVSSYSWNTSGLSGLATGITGQSTSRLQFTWTNSVMQQAGATASATLTVTNTLGQTEQQTYSFYIPYGSVGSSSGGGGTTWPRMLVPSTVRPESPDFVTHHASVASVSGALEAGIVLPAYSPNIAPLALEYDSLAADPRPIVVVHHALDAAQSVPLKVSGRLTFNGSNLSTYYYDTSQFIPGDVMQMSFQADATALATGSYSYSVATGDIRGTTTTTTDSGTLTVVNEASSAFGAGWTLAGLNRIVAATGGVILNLGGGDALWFSGTGGTYTSPAGEFSTLVKNPDSTYTRTLTNGTKQHFDTSGRQTATADRNDLRVTYAYDGSGKVTTITDPYAKVTTLAYDANGKLQKVTDPANRVTTFTIAGGKLASVQLPDLATWSYSYDTAGRLTKVTDPRSKALTVTYDGAGRASGTTRPDLTTEAFTPYQAQGLGTSTNSASPGPATLMAEAVAKYVDPRGYARDLRPDWTGMGLVNQKTDPDGYVSTSYRDANGLATVAIDRLNRATRFAYDSKGNVVTLTYADRNSETFSYNGFSQVTAHTDARGKTTSYTYDVKGNLTVIQDALLNRTTMTYTANGRVGTTRDARNNVTSYAYDSQDRLTTTTFPGGATKLLAYDAKGNVATITDERGGITATTYDALNRPTVKADALMNRTTLSYDSGGNLTQVQEPLSRTTTYAYDAMDRLTTITAPLSRVTVYGYDAAGNRATVKDPLNRITTTTFDGQGRPTVVITPLNGAINAVTTTIYDAEGQATQIIDPLNRITTVTYNSRGWRSTVTDPLGNTATYTYSATGKLANRSDASSGGATQFNVGYDDLDRKVAVTDALNHTTTTVYDAVGNVIATVDANGNRTTLAYDAHNRLTTVTDPLNHTTLYGYDSGGNRTTVTDSLGHTTTTAYDALNRGTTITDALGGVTTLAYDAAGRQVGLTDPVGNRTTWAYDAADRLTTLTDALGTATYAYDAADQLIDRTDRAGRRVTFAYDSGGRRTNERWLNGVGGAIRTVSYTYDAADQMTVVADLDATLAFTYDSGGRLVAAQTSGGGSGQPNVILTSGYDAGGKRTNLTDNLSSIGRTTYTYDAAQRLVGVDRTLGGTAGPRIVYGYDNADRLTSVSRTLGGSGTAVNSSLGYDAADRLTTLAYEKFVPAPSGGSATTTPLAAYAYVYDNANRLASETNAEGTVTYTYDDTSQLTGATGSRSESYGYDLNGNRNTTGYTTGAGNKLAVSPGTTYGYDAEGNLTTKTETTTGQVTTYSYDHRNRMTGTTQRSSGGTVLMQATYTYDAQDRRIGTKVDADGAGPGAAVQAWTVYDGQNPYADFTGADTLQKRYLHGLAVDELLARTDSAGTTAWYLADKLGSVRDVVDTSGAVINHIVYDSFGKVVSETSPANGDRHKFTGREYDAETGLYYYRARYYDSTTGRFLEQDPVGFSAGDANLYRYVGNSPTNATDPSGNFGVAGALVGGSVGAVVGGLLAWHSGGDAWSIWVGVGSGYVGGAIAGTGVGLVGGGIMGSIGGAVGTAAGNYANDPQMMWSNPYGFWGGVGLGALIGGAGGALTGGFKGRYDLDEPETLWSAILATKIDILTGVATGFGTWAGAQISSVIGNLAGKANPPDGGGHGVSNPMTGITSPSPQIVISPTPQIASNNSGRRPTNWDTQPGDPSPFPEFWGSVGYHLFGGTSGGQSSSGLFG
ncbi:RHS repeat-associated core domain-containing protein [Paludisphaera sp.]|uniref:RHS repeat-associated core domain-containing protein n=1 Tax=Paludisphaera sp. TaxID=2017432 RepID=UPI00301D27FA